MAIWLQNLAVRDRTAEVRQAHDLVVSIAQDAVGTGENHAFDSAIRADCAGHCRTRHVISSAHQAIRAGTEQWLRSALEDAAVGLVGNGGERDLLTVASRVNALHGVERFMAGDQILLRRLRGSDCGSKRRNHGEKANRQDDHSDHHFDHGKSPRFPSTIVVHRFLVPYCCTHIGAPPCRTSRQPRIRPVAPHTVMACDSYSVPPARDRYTTPLFRLPSVSREEPSGMKVT